jgi:tryptophan halogenase
MTHAEPLRHIVIVGGGTAGWMTAAYLARLALPGCQVQLVESDEIASVGVGEATIPFIANFNRFLGLDEAEFLRETQGTYKLGIEFVNWGQLGESYFHGFSPIGSPLDDVSCHQYWLRQRQQGLPVPDLGELCIGVVAARQGKYLPRQADRPHSPLSHLFNAFHFDAALYARYLRRYAEARGVRRTEGRVQRVLQRPGDGFIQSIELARADGVELIEGDLFIDCTGMRALLLGQALGEPYEDWSHWLPCDRAIAVPCASAGPLLPFTRSTAHSAGWQWRIPLQHRTGNGHVYSSAFMGEDEATATLLRHLDGAPLAEPRCIPFVPGRRRRTWVNNCVAVGLSSGFFEPLESTNIHLIQSAIQRLVSLLPNARIDPAEVEEYNRQTQFEYERVRDFIILHYKATRRDDSAFWRHCRDMPVPDSLRQKMALYASSGRAFREGGELFSEVSWVQVMQGQGIEPRRHDPLADARPEGDVRAYLANVRDVIQACVSAMPEHAQFLEDSGATRGPA